MHVISCVGQVKPLNYNRLSRRTAMLDLISCHAGQQWEVRHGPCVTRRSHRFTCHPHTDHSFVCTPQSQGNRPLTGTKLYCLVTEAHGCKYLPKATAQWCRGSTWTRDLYGIRMRGMAFLPHQGTSAVTRKRSASCFTNYCRQYFVHFCV